MYITCSVFSIKVLPKSTEIINGHTKFTTSSVTALVMDCSCKAPSHYCEVENTQHDWGASSRCGHHSVSARRSYLGPLCTEHCVGSLSQPLPSQYRPYTHVHFSTPLSHSGDWSPYDLCGKSWNKVPGTMEASFSHTPWFIMSHHSTTTTDETSNIKYRSSGNFRRWKIFVDEPYWRKLSTRNIFYSKYI